MFLPWPSMCVHGATPHELMGHSRGENEVELCKQSERFNGIVGTAGCFE